MPPSLQRSVPCADDDFFRHIAQRFLQVKSHFLMRIALCCAQKGLQGGYKSVTMSGAMKIAVIGKGGREHALIKTLAASPVQPQIFSFPGSDAIFQVARSIPVKNLHELIEWMKAEGIDLCLAGEESYLVKDEGLANPLLGTVQGECATGSIQGLRQAISDASRHTNRARANSEQRG